MTDTSAIPENIAAVFRNHFKHYTGPIFRELSADQVPGWDSLSHAEFILSLEDTLNVRLDPARVFDYQTLGDLVDDLTRVRQ